MTATIVVIAFFVLLVLIIIGYYNRFVTLRNRIDNAWSQIDVQLKRRYDLIPNLVETVKGYAKHEKEVFEHVTEMRSKAISASSVTDQADAENQLTQTLKSLFAVAENYPELKANQNFLALQEELSGTESKIAYSRQFYNDSVYQYNTAIQIFPGNMMAGPFGFSQRQYFETEPESRGPVKVEF
ncbi:MAG: LemA family protein [Rubrobacteridae bacterium]|nr:LemA family protein [Rubrobacteridae bacterium]